MAWADLALAIRIKHSRINNRRVRIRHKRSLRSVLVLHHLTITLDKVCLVKARVSNPRRSQEGCLDRHSKVRQARQAVYSVRQVKLEVYSDKHKVKQVKQVNQAKRQACSGKRKVKQARQTACLARHRRNQVVCLGKRKTMLKRIPSIKIKHRTRPKINNKIRTRITYRNLRKA